MTDPNLTHLYFVLDRSGSMESIRESTQAGFDAFIAEQRSTPGECRVTLVQFDEVYERVYANVALGDVPPLQLEPRGSTALLDAIGRTILTAGAELAALPEEARPGSVVFGILTDGHENASREFTHARVREMIEHQTTVYSWRFLFMGADQDAIEVGMAMGISRDQSVTYSRDNVGLAMRSAASNLGQYRRAKSSGVSEDEATRKLAFTPGQREEAVEPASKP